MAQNLKISVVRTTITWQKLYIPPKSFNKRSIGTLFRCAPNILSCAFFCSWSPWLSWLVFFLGDCIWRFIWRERSFAPQVPIIGHEEVVAVIATTIRSSWPRDVSLLGHGLALSAWGIICASWRTTGPLLHISCEKIADEVQLYKNVEFLGE